MSVLVVLISSRYSEANEIYVNQVGDDVEITIVQDGENNQIKGYDSQDAAWEGDNNKIEIKQKTVETGSSGQLVEMDIIGDNNDVFVGQGFGTYSGGYTNRTQTDSTEGGSHTASIDLKGDNNELYLGQRNGSGFSSTPQYDSHSATVIIDGDDNKVGLFQGHDGSKTLDLTINNDDNDVDIRQMGYDAEHTADVTLDGTYGTDLFLNQYSTTDKSYTLNQYCQNANGCSVSVTQN